LWYLWTDPHTKVAIESDTQRRVVLAVHGEQLAVHADSRLHCVARSLGKEALLDDARALSAEIDDLWDTRA
jgi:hypothetical protein